MKPYPVTLAIITILIMALSGGVATALTASSSTTPTTTVDIQPASITQALPGQGSIVGGALLGSSTPTFLPSLATTTAAATTTIGLGVLSEHNKLALAG